MTIPPVRIARTHFSLSPPAPHRSLLNSYFLPSHPLSFPRIDLPTPHTSNNSLHVSERYIPVFWFTSLPPTCHPSNLAWTATSMPTSHLPALKKSDLARKEITKRSTRLTWTVAGALSGELVRVSPYPCGPSHGPFGHHSLPTLGRGLPTPGFEEVPRSVLCILAKPTIFLLDAFPTLSRKTPGSLRAVSGDVWI